MLRVKYERLRRNLSQKIVAAHVGLRQPQVSMVESGVLKPSPAKLRRFEDLYRIKGDDLMREITVLP